MVVVLPSLGAMFVHIPRTGGAAITKALLPWAAPNQDKPFREVGEPGWLEHWHHWGGQFCAWKSARRYAQPFVREAWKVVSVIRDPWDRAASLYQDRGGEAAPGEWIRRDAAESGLWPGIVHVPEGAFMLQYESLDEDFAEVMAELGVEDPPTLERVGATKAPDPRSLWDTSELSLIGRMLSWDVECGDYIHPRMRA